MSTRTRIEVICDEEVIADPDQRAVLDTLAWLVREVVELRPGRHTNEQELDGPHKIANGTTRVLEQHFKGLSGYFKVAEKEVE